jgi:PEP-CTERM motif
LLDREWFAFSHHKIILGFGIMNTRSRLLFAGFSVGALAAGFTAPAHATLQFTVGFVGSEASFTCVDNSACDSNSAVGVIDIPTISFQGLVGTDIVVESLGTVNGPGDATLRYRVGSLSNGSGETLNGRFALSDTNFRGPPGRFQTKADVAWTNGGDSSLDLISTFDTNNAQGGNTPTDAPGSQIDAVTFLASAGDQTHSMLGSVSGSSLYSLSDQGTLQLVAGASVSGGQDVTVAIVPEPSTWAMMAIGFVGLGFAGYKRARRRPALV